jgi:hypothetical protein
MTVLPGKVVRSASQAIGRPMTRANKVLETAKMSVF